MISTLDPTVVNIDQPLYPLNLLPHTSSSDGYGVGYGYDYSIGDGYGGGCLNGYGYGCPTIIGYGMNPSYADADGRGSGYTQPNGASHRCTQ